jgi:hypothetical protein
LPQLLRLSSDTAGGAALPASMSRPRRYAACRPQIRVLLLPGIQAHP